MIIIIISTIHLKITVTRAYFTSSTIGEPHPESSSQSGNAKILRLADLSDSINISTYAKHCSKQVSAKPG